VHIRIKERAKFQPVFLKALPRGLGVTNEPMSADSFKEYLKRRCTDLGIVGPDVTAQPTLYAWRRAAGTKVHRQEGLDRAKAFMHHSAESTTFFKYYDRGVEDLDVVGIGLDEEKMNLNETVLLESSAAVNRIDKHFVDREVFLQKFVDECEDVIAKVNAFNTSGTNTNSVAVLNAKRNARSEGERALQRIERELADDEMTTEELASRVRELQQGSKLMKKVKDIIASNNSIPEGEEDTQYDDEYLLVDADNYITDVGVDNGMERRNPNQ